MSHWLIARERVPAGETMDCLALSMWRTVWRRGAEQVDARTMGRLGALMTHEASCRCMQRRPLILPVEDSGACSGSLVSQHAAHACSICCCRAVQRRAHPDSVHAVHARSLEHGVVCLPGGVEHAVGQVLPANKDAVQIALCAAVGDVAPVVAALNLPQAREPVQHSDLRQGKAGWTPRMVWGAGWSWVIQACPVCISSGAKACVLG